MDRFGEAVRVGDTVTYAEQPWMHGVVVQRVNLEYVRVLWDDLSAPLTHRESSLKKAPAASRSVLACVAG